MYPMESNIVSVSETVKYLETGSVSAIFTMHDKASPIKQIKKNINILNTRFSKNSSEISQIW
jgi:hypothetical protein